MFSRMMGSHIWSASLLLGLCLITMSCGASTPTTGSTSPTLTPSPSPTAAVSPSPTTTAIANAACSSDFSNPPGPLPTTIPLPPGTLVNKHSMGIMAGSAGFYLCTPETTEAAITAFMNSALPAAGWMRNSVRACNAPSYQWFKGKYGMDIVFDSSLFPNVWVLDICPHVGEN